MPKPKKQPRPKKYKSKKGKQHPAHAESFQRIAKHLRSILRGGNIKWLGGTEALCYVTGAFEKEAKRLRKIVR